MIPPDSGHENATHAPYVPPHMRGRVDSTDMGKTEPLADVQALSERNEVYRTLSSVKRQYNKTQGYADTCQQLERVFDMFRRQPFSSGKVMMPGITFGAGLGDGGSGFLDLGSRVIVDVCGDVKFTVSADGEVLEMYSQPPHKRVVVTTPATAVGVGDRPGTLEFDFKAKNKMPLEGVLYERVQALVAEAPISRRSDMTVEAYVRALGGRLSSAAELYDRKIKVIARVCRRHFNIEERQNTVCLCKAYGGGLMVVKHAKTFARIHMGLSLEKNLEYLCLK